MLPIQLSLNQPINTTSLPPKNLITSFFLVDPSVRSLSFMFTLYYPSEENFMCCFIQLEFLPTGILIASTMKLIVFYPNIYNTKSLILADFICFILVFIFLIFMFIEYFNYYTAKTLTEKPKLNDIIFNSKTFLNLFIFFMFCISFFYKLTKCFNNPSDFSNENLNLIDTFSVASAYNRVFYYESLIFAAVSIKILTFLRLNDYV